MPDHAISYAKFIVLYAVCCAVSLFVTYILAMFVDVSVAKKGAERLDAKN